MSALQWALLILSVGIVIALVVISRRDRGLLPKPRNRDAEETPEAPVREQLDIFSSQANAESRSASSRMAPLFESFEGGASAARAPVESDEMLGVVSKPRRVPAPAAEEPAESPFLRAPLPRGEPEPAEPPPVNDAPTIAPLGNAQFDEYGVGRARRRQAPTLDGESEQELPPAAPVEPPPERLPPWVRASNAPTATLAASNDPAPAPKAPAPPAQKIVALLIVEREGGVIAGPKLHTVLSAQGLVFGNKQIYHRMVRGQAVFSVASLMKPGVLIPGEAAEFSTPGLSAFMVLPGPVKPVSALHDLLATAQALARALNAEVYDSKKQPLSSELMRALQADVEAWARSAG